MYTIVNQRSFVKFYGILPTKKWTRLPGPTVPIIKNDRSKDWGTQLGKPQKTAKKVPQLMASPLRGGGVKAGPLRFILLIFKH